MGRLEGKKAIIAALSRELADDASIGDAIDYLLYLQGIEEGLDDEEAGRLITQDEVVEEIARKSAKDVRATIAEIRAFRKGRLLEGETIRELIDEGRRF
ncbi:MAG: hypothetical protein ABIP58_01675 [Dehalococcoidia bacterium]